MKKIFTPVVLAVLAACSMTIPINEEPLNERMQANANQHMAVGVLAAVFFCERGEWPRSLHELRGFGAAGRLSLPVAVDWDWLARPGVKYTAGRQIVLQTPGGQAAGDVAVSSLHSRPGCDGSAINPRIHLDF